MKYSLLSRFQGCLEGMAIADQLGTWVHQATQAAALQSATDLPEKDLTHRLSTLHWHHWYPGISSSPSDLVTLRPSPWVEVALQVGEAIIQTNGWSAQSMVLDARPLLEAGSPSGALAIATLPITLFFHDDLRLQQQHLRQTVRVWGGSPTIEDWVVVFGYAIAQALKEQLIPHQVMAHLLTYLNTKESDWQQRSPEVLQTLQMLQHWLENGTGVDVACLKTEQLLSQDAKTMVLALYCFLCTPDQWHLSVVHAARLLPSQPEICALTASLSGAYNSHSSLPLGWKVASYSSTVLISSAQSIPIPVTCAKLSAQLLGTWSGLLNGSSGLAVKTLPVAAP